MSDRLEEYVLGITDPVDPIFSQTDQPVIKVEKISNETVIPWNPKTPEHSGGDQHLNVGLDFFSATRVESDVLEDTDYHYAIIDTGIRMELPYGYHMMIGSRSGLGFKRHIQAFPGIIDSSYRGEIKIKLYSHVPFSIDVNEKIAQGLIFKSENYQIIESQVDTNTTRGEQGFGSTDLPKG